MADHGWVTVDGETVPRGSFAHTTRKDEALTSEIAEMIADWFGRPVIDADHELAASIILRVRQS